MAEKISHPACRQHQRGVALMVALVLMAILSVLGISAMRSATLENQLASNTISKELTFQTADSASDSAATSTSLLESVICDPEATVLDRSNLNQITAQSTSVSVRHAGMANPEGNSVNKFMTYRFQVTGTSEITAQNTRTTIEQGILIVGPNTGTGVCQSAQAAAGGP